jgi:Fe-S-cluster containining protein
VSANVADARGLSFSCKPGCGFCCTASPLVLPAEAPPLGEWVRRTDDGTLRIPIQGVSCSALRDDRGCGVYEARPTVCHLYPYQVHAARRIQVSVTLACPGVEAMHPTDPDTEGTRQHPFGVDHLAETGARQAAEVALAQPGAAQMAARAKETFAEFDRRMKEWGVQATPDQLRAGFLPHLDRIARADSLPAYFGGLGEGDLVLGRDPPLAVAALFEAEPEDELRTLLEAAAREGLDAPDTAMWVEADFAWTVPSSDGETVTLARILGGARTQRELRVAEIPLAWTEDASAQLSRYLHTLCHRDQTEASAAWLVDASRYQVTPAAAFARVLGEASLQVILRAGLLALEAQLDEIDVALARRGIAAYETAYHSLPTLGSIL